VQSCANEVHRLFFGAEIHSVGGRYFDLRLELGAPICFSPYLFPSLFVPSLAHSYILSVSLSLSQLIISSVISFQFDYTCFARDDASANLNIKLLPALNSEVCFIY
jgi:hypothetical protein